MNIAIPEYFAIYNDSKRFGLPKMGHMKERYRKTSETNGKASACIECGMCEEHCPQKLPIREFLKNVSEVFD